MGWDFLFLSRCQQWLLCGPVQKAKLLKAGKLYKGGDRKAPPTGRELADSRPCHAEKQVLLQS
ncbi:hypothetical protein EK904_006629 [Melospiza melodia maxima]|nr:hypothetical protein EK904_006629 [Melospiza melodia maxima]